MTSTVASVTAVRPLGIIRVEKFVMDMSFLSSIALQFARHARGAVFFVHSFQSSSAPSAIWPSR